MKTTPGGILTTLHSFNFNDGANPYAGLIQATDGNFYGTTEAGGAHSAGTVFRITPGTLTTLHSFNWGDGANPYAGLIQASDGNFYGPTESGGAKRGGTVFKMTPLGVLSTLHSFNTTDGSSPEAPLIQAADGNFYSTTYNGGSSDGSYGTGQPSDWVFASKRSKGKKRSAGILTADYLRPAAAAAGVQLGPGQRFGFHNFRHGLATWLVNQVTDVKTVQGLLRHANVTTTLGIRAHGRCEHDGGSGSGAAGHEVREPDGELAGDFAGEFL